MSAVLVGCSGDKTFEELGVGVVYLHKSLVYICLITIFPEWADSWPPTLLRTSVEASVADMVCFELMIMCGFLYRGKHTNTQRTSGPLYGSQICTALRKYNTYIHCMRWAMCVEWYHPISGALFIAASQLMPSRRTSHAQCSYHIQSIIALFSSTITVLHVYISLMKSVYLCIHYCEDMWVSTQLYSSFCAYVCMYICTLCYILLHDKS